MADTAETVIKTAFAPISLQGRPFVWRIGALVLGVLLLTLSSYIKVAMIPVPVTMQTLAVTLIGAIYGWRFGGLTIMAWLLQGALGMPVLAGGAAGIQHFTGPTGGYLLAFPIAGALMGWLTQRGWNGNRMVFAFAGMLISNGLCLLFGATWLATNIGAEQALMLGALPFLAGGVLKSVLGAFILKLLPWNKSA
ncbi:MAG TPA: biotin transporter BioY [Herbaspirillum sp.]|nr:biotin transporter BioY [Herbaspirillum sp.]